MRSDIEGVIADSDLLVVGLSDAKVFDAIARHVRDDQTVLDLVRIPNAGELPAQVIGLCW
jgi:GDP-mannose 6-dehydrogenase